MRILYHLPLSPFCRKLRLALREKSLDFELRVERVWERRPEFLALNPAGQVPVLVEEGGRPLADSSAIAEYLEETYPDRRLLGRSAVERAETRRLVAWFDQKFHAEVTLNLLFEKVNKRFYGLGNPDSAAIRMGKQFISGHLDYIADLSERRRWLAGDEFSLADMAAAAHLSCIDYLGDVPWDAHPRAKDWYVRVKSRPSFRPLLGDHVAGMPPPPHYADLDF
ncbi:glutathione S-transferase family protein [Zavarzinia compransoris]|uniref:Glutathione S-transferase n=1 Tax=Zavarzinia compransoris TaxID=1264899 RepID=A0A317E764_9PROT|nr:glutathione S-transferase family protein [Zavarzinia compransoris]PWR22124.1 glutathione S-transferase [Zavarzinia compransoris]TDP47128.1 glutathione S-transferase [Zavarzinia compransoris]